MSPWMAPQAAIAADTPQIDTAVDSMAPNSSSTLQLPAQPEAGIPDDEHHQHRLHDAERAGLQHFIEQEAGAEDDQAGLDEELGLHRGLQPCRRADGVADQQPEQQREDDVFDAEIHERAVAGEEARDEGEAEDHRQPDQERHYARADQRNADRANHQKAEPDIQHLREIAPGEHAFGSRSRVAADLGAERAGKGAAAERRQLAGGAFDRLAVTAPERIAEILG